MTDLPQTGQPIPIIGADADLQAELLAPTQERIQVARRVPQANEPTASLAKSVEEKTFPFFAYQRKQARYEIARPVTCYPVLQSHEVSSSSAIEGTSIDIGVGGMKMLLGHKGESFKGIELLVGIEQNNGSRDFIAGTVINEEANEYGTEIALGFRGYLHEVLAKEQIHPTLNTDEMQYVIPYPDAMLASLCRVGAASSVELDQILLCPNCHGVPTFRYGCSRCLSSNVNASRMIHHFACANVDFTEVFEVEDGLQCPKCRMRRMIVGSDYEYLDGPNMCYDCGQSNLEKIQIGHCLSCGNRFPAETAFEMNVQGYSVCRLDILAFVNSQR